MLDLNKHSFIEGQIARAVGTVIGSIQAEQSAHKARCAQYKQWKGRQDAEIMALREQRRNK